MHATITAEELTAFLINNLAKITGLEESKIDKNARLQSFALDSIHTMQLIIEIEEKYGIELNPLLFWESPSLEWLGKQIRDQIVAPLK